MNNERLFNNRKSGIILAADVSTLAQLDKLLELARSTPAIVALKVGFTLSLRFGLRQVVQRVRSKHELPVIYDHQKAGTDIPDMGRPFAKACRDCGAKAAIFFPQAGPKTLEGFVTGALAEKLVPIVRLVMTHSAYLQSEGGFIMDDAPDRICKLAMDLGVTNFVLPGTKTDLVQHFAFIFKEKRLDATIMMPGIGSQGGSIQQAFMAAEPLRRFAIIGSSIYAAKNPDAVLADLVSEADL